MDLYWEERAERKVLAGEKTEQELLKTMQNVYKNSLSSIEKEINAFYGRYAYNNKLSLNEVKKRLNPQELASAKQEIKKYYDMVEPSKIGPKMAKAYRDELRLQSAKAYMSRLEELKISLKHELIELGGEEDSEFTKALGDIYQDTYNKTSFDIDKYRGYTSNEFYGLNEKKLRKGLEQRWLEENYSDRIWKNKGKLMNQLETTFLQGVAQGYNPKKIASIMAKNYGTSFYNCVRLARTEGGHIMGEATMESYKDHKIKKYQYVATLDNRTSDVCKHLDGKVFDIKDAKEGINYPEMHPNCRSTTIPYFEPDEIDAQFEESTRIARNDDGELYYVPASTTYEQWKGNTKKPVLDKIDMSKDNILIKAKKNNLFNFKVQDKVLSAEEDGKNVNIHFMDSILRRKINGKGKPTPKYKYTENCQRCCPTYEMRRRGYDVKAKPLPNKDDSLQYGSRWSKIFTDKDGNYVEPTPIGSGTFEEVQQKIKEMGDGARVEIRVGWNVRSGHVFMAENVNGDVYYIEPQIPEKSLIGKNECWYFKRTVKQSMYILRLDNLIPTSVILDCMENKE